jgi:hypothetical protein
MARFRGVIQGTRGQASRLGHATLRTYAASWQGAISVELYKQGDFDYAEVRIVPHHGAGSSHLLYDGPVAGIENGFPMIRLQIEAYGKQYRERT